MDVSNEKLAIIRGANIEIRDIKNGKLLQILLGDNDNINVICFSLNGKYLISGMEHNWSQTKHNLIMWNLDSGLPIFGISTENDIHALAFSPDSSKFITAGQNKTITVRNSQNGSHIKTFYKCSFEISCLSYSPDGKHIVFAYSEGNYGIFMLNEKTDNIDCAVYQSYRIASLCYAPNSKHLVAGTNTGRIVIIDMEQKELLHDFIENTNLISKICCI